MSNDGKCDVFANCDSSNVHEHFKEVMVPILTDIKNVVDKDGYAIVAIENIKDLTDTQDKSNIWVYWLLKSILWNEANLEVCVSHLGHNMDIVTFKNASKDYNIPESICRVTGYDIGKERIEKEEKIRIQICNKYRRQEEERIEREEREEEKRIEREERKGRHVESKEERRIRREKEYLEIEKYIQREKYVDEHYN